MSKKIMTIKDKTKAIREDLKKHGISNRKVSVRGDHIVYDDYIDVTIKDLTVSKKLVDKIVSKYNSIRYDQYSGEILQGLNTFINVEFDWYKLNDASEKLLPLAKKIKEKYKNTGIDTGEHIAKDGDLEIIYWVKPSQTTPTITLYKNILIKDEEFGNYIDDKILLRHIACNEQEIARALALFKYQFGFNLNNINV